MLQTVDIWSLHKHLCPGSLSFNAATIEIATICTISAVRFQHLGWHPSWHLDWHLDRSSAQQLQDHLNSVHYQLQFYPNKKCDDVAYM